MRITVPLPTPARRTSAAFFRKQGLKLIAALLWLSLISSYVWYYRSQGLTTATALAQIVQLLDSRWGPGLYILLYTVRPLLFFSSTVLTIVSGAVFGAGSLANLALAVLYTAIGSNLSASLAYAIGRFFGNGLVPENVIENNPLAQRYVDRMRQHSFETVLIMRFIFLPYDLVNYLAGILHIHWPAFVLATLLGSLPGTLAFVSFGASIDLKQLAIGQRPPLNPWVFLFGLTILMLTITTARYVKKRATGQTNQRSKRGKSI